MKLFDECLYIEFDDKHPKDCKESRKYKNAPDPRWKSYGIKYPEGIFKLDIDDYDKKTGEPKEFIKGKPRSDFVLEMLHKQKVYPPYFITPRGKHFIFGCRPEMERKTKQDWVSPINVIGEWKFPESDDHVPLVVNGVERISVDGENEIPECPKWLTFLQKSRTKQKDNFDMNFQEGNRTNPFGGYVLYLTEKKGFTKDEAFLTVEIINQSFENPQPDDVLHSQTLNESTAEKCLENEEHFKNGSISPETFKRFLNSLGMSIKYNELLNVVEYEGIPDTPEFQEITDIQNVMPIKLQYEYRKFTGKQNITKHQVIDLISLEADTHSYNPVKEYLQSVEWDGRDRFPELFNILGVTDELQKVMVKKWFYQTAGMPFNTLEEPFSAEGVLVLQGAEGIGKTRFFKGISVDSNWFSELNQELNTKNKDIQIQMLSLWVGEIGEVDRTFKANKSDIKSFITATDDTIRKPYRMEQVKKARITSFCGTTNKDEFLNDDTGSRRWWVIPIKKKIVLGDFAKKDNLQQFWAQCYHEYKENNECFRLTDDEMNQIKAVNKTAMEMLPAEEELRNRFDFDAPDSEWGWTTSSGLKNLPEYDVEKYTVEQIGKALKRISTDVSMVTHRRHKGKNQYLVPPAIKCTDRYRNKCL